MYRLVHTHRIFIIYLLPTLLFFFFFFNDTATTEIYTLSLHDALPISFCSRRERLLFLTLPCRPRLHRRGRLRVLWRPPLLDRKSTRLNSSHTVISYAVFCLKKKKNEHHDILYRPAVTDKGLLCRGYVD